MEEGIYIGNLQIPIAKGEKGDTGAAGKIKSINVVMLSSTATAYAQNNGTENEAQLELGIPKGVGISNVEIVDEDLIVHLDNGTDLNCGGVVGLGVVSIVLNEDYDFIMTLSDGSTETVGNIETALRNMLTDYYTSAETDTMLDNITDEIKETFGHSLSMTLNPTTYVLTIGLNDYAGTSLDTKTVDLPLESVVVSGRYDNTTKKVILTLQNGSTVEFSVADLVAGLVSESTFNTTIQQINTTLGTKADESDIPTKTSDLTNDSGYVTSTDYATSNKSGVLKGNVNGFQVASSGGIPSASTYTYNAYQSLGNNGVFIGKGTLDNVLNATIGDIDSILQELDTGSGV
jgi:hypothetical protein